MCIGNVQLLSLEEPWTLIIDDALANSFVAPVTDNIQDDSQLTREFPLPYFADSGKLCLAQQSSRKSTFQSYLRVWVNTSLVIGVFQVWGLKMLNPPLNYHFGPTQKSKIFSVSHSVDILKM